jgi:hypothetical protein
MDSITINIAGDLFLGGRIESRAIHDPVSLFDSKVLNLFTNSDFNVVNLESPLTNAGDEDQILKMGPNMKASPDTIGVLELLKINLVTLANNHIYDFGKNGLSDTLDLCERSEISSVGAGLTLNSASLVYLKEINGLTIGFVNIAENEESSANETHGGANPMNIIANTRTLHEIRKTADIVILIIHGGHELYYFPSPRMVDQYRYYAEEGASIIVSHHTHCISGFEIHKNVPIFYGLGNFLFENDTDFKGWYEGVLLKLTINQEKKIDWRLIPYKQCKHKLLVELMEDSEKVQIENEILDINEIIADPVKLSEKFNELINSRKVHILSMYSTSYILKYKYLRSAIRKLGMERLFLRKDQLKSILNYSRCESHKDITFKVIDDYLNVK